MSIKDWASDARPYEKFNKYGMDALTDTDLLAIMLRTGTKDCTVKELAERLLTYDELTVGNAKTQNLLGLFDRSYEELQKIKGIGKIKALQILTINELSTRIVKAKKYPSEKVTNPEALSDYFMESLRHLHEEYFIVVFLDAKCKMIGHEIVSKGSLTASIVHPREVYKLAISRSSHSIIVLHNHPSGDPMPSNEDIQITKRLKSVGEVIGIPLLDHIIIGDGNYKSLRKESYI